MTKGTIKDVLQILFGLIVYSIGFTCFMLPYDITSGGVSGISALIYYATGFHANYSYFIINMGLLMLALYHMGRQYTVKTVVATILVSSAIGIIQDMITITDPDGTQHLMKLVGDQKFMACTIGGLMEGLGLALVFLAGGSTGGTDIIASCVNKYWNISLGRLMLYLDIVIISCSYLIFHSVETMIIGYLTMLISMTFLDYVVNGARQSVQFIIVSEKYEEIAKSVVTEVNRGVTILHGQGWYSKEDRHVLLIMARKYESRQIFRLIKQIDHNAFVAMSNAEGVFGEGFDVIKKSV